MTIAEKLAEKLAAMEAEARYVPHPVQEAMMELAKIIDEAASTPAPAAPVASED